jgi:hypothetical protein
VKSVDDGYGTKHDDGHVCAGLALGGGSHYGCVHSEQVTHVERRWKNPSRGMVWCEACSAFLQNFRLCGSYQAGKQEIEQTERS